LRTGAATLAAWEVYTENVTEYFDLHSIGYQVVVELRRNGCNAQPRRAARRRPAND
jgi:hypothetical protein